MKHSSPVKYPVSFLIFCLSFSFLSLLLTGWFVYGRWQQSRRTVDNVDNQIVSQLDRSQFEQALRILRNK